MKSATLKVGERAPDGRIFLGWRVTYDCSAHGHPHSTAIFAHRDGKSPLDGKTLDELATYWNGRVVTVFRRENCYRKILRQLVRDDDRGYRDGQLWHDARELLEEK